MDTLYIVLGALVFLYFIMKRRGKTPVKVEQIAYDREKNLIAVTVKNNKPTTFKLKTSIRAKFQQIATPSADGKIVMSPAQANGRNMLMLVAEDDLPRTIAPNETITFTYTPLQTPQEIGASSNFTVDFKFIEYSKVAGTEFDTETIKEAEKKAEEKIVKIEQKADALIDIPSVETITNIPVIVTPTLLTEPSTSLHTEPTKLETPIDLLTDIEDIEATPKKIPVIDLFKDPEDQPNLLEEPTVPPKTIPWAKLKPYNTGRYIGNRLTILEMLNRLDELKQDNHKRFSTINDEEIAI